MLKEGDKAPAFELPSDRGGVVRLGDFAGKSVVVYFYPKDNTPGCTREAQAFSASGKDLAKAGASVVGISKDSIASHCKFRDAYALSFPLLSDADLSVHKAYGAYGEKMMYGKKVTGVIRSTFVIGPDGRVVRAFRNVKVDGHADAVLEALGGRASAARPKVKSAAPAPAKKSVTRSAPKKASAPAKRATKGAGKGAAKKGASARVASRAARKR